MEGGRRKREERRRLRRDKKPYFPLFLLSLILILTPIFSAMAAQGDEAMDGSSQVYPHHWEPYGPRVDTLIFKVVPELDDQLSLLRRGRLEQAGLYLSQLEIGRVNKDANILIQVTPRYGAYILTLNLDEYPLDLVGFREALAKIIPKKALVDRFLLGFGETLDTVVPPIYGEYHNPGVEAPLYDPQGAEALLEGLGFRDMDGDGVRNDPETGENLPPIQLAVPLYDLVALKAGEMIAEEAEALGIRIQVEAMNTSSLEEAAYWGRSFQLMIQEWSLDPDLYYLWSYFHSSQVAPRGFNIAGVKDEGLDGLLEKALNTTDPEGLKEVIWGIQEVVAEKLYSIPLYTRMAVTAQRYGWWGYVDEPGIGTVNLGLTFMNVHPWEAPIGGEFRFALGGDISQGNIFTSPIPFRIWDRYVYSCLYESPLKRDPFTKEWRNWLTTGFETGFEEENIPRYFLQGKKGYYVKLTFKEGIKFHDGTPLTAEDFKFTLEYAKEKGLPWPWPLQSFYRIDVKDSTVTIHFIEESPWALSWIGGQFIVPRHLWENVTDPLNYMDEKPIGTGPFQWEERREGEYIKLLPNPDYHHSIKNKIEKIERVKAAIKRAEEEGRLLGLAEATFLLAEAEDILRTLTLSNLEEYDRVDGLLAMAEERVREAVAPRFQVTAFKPTPYYPRKISPPIEFQAKEFEPLWSEAPPPLNRSKIAILIAGLAALLFTLALAIAMIIPQKPSTPK